MDVLWVVGAVVVLLLSVRQTKELQGRKHLVLLPMLLSAVTLLLAVLLGAPKAAGLVLIVSVFASGYLVLERRPDA